MDLALPDYEEKEIFSDLDEEEPAPAGSSFDIPPPPPPPSPAQFQMKPAKSYGPPTIPPPPPPPSPSQNPLKPAKTNSAPAISSPISHEAQAETINMQRAKEIADHAADKLRHLAAGNTVRFPIDNNITCTITLHGSASDTNTSNDDWINDHSIADCSSVEFTTASRGKSCRKITVGIDFRTNEFQYKLPEADTELNPAETLLMRRTVKHLVSKLELMLLETDYRELLEQGTEKVHTEVAALFGQFYTAAPPDES
ncbi:MAG: hypothetical protein PHZ00_07960 [Candidatus Peribacteraceae bacterium]|nr:hypothetical protein [Candidatus Peribacteraceae bacterium]